MNKLLTGQHIYETARSIQGLSSTYTWEEFCKKPENVVIYNQTAKMLNQDLGLCEECGERPVDPNMMLEVAGDNVCSDCCNAAQNFDNTTQLKEQMSHISFVLHYEDFDCKPAQATVQTMNELWALIHENTSRELPTKSDFSLPSSHHEYSVDVIKDGVKIGHAQYIRNYDLDRIIKEEGAAEGINDALQEYSFMSSMTGEENE